MIFSLVTTPLHYLLSAPIKISSEHDNNNYVSAFDQYTSAMLRSFLFSINRHFGGCVSFDFTALSCLNHKTCFSNSAFFSRGGDGFSCWFNHLQRDWRIFLFPAYSDWVILGRKGTRTLKRLFVRIDCVQAFRRSWEIKSGPTKPEASQSARSYFVLNWSKPRTDCRYI